MANPAFTADVEARWRTLSDQETLNAEVFLEDAWVMLKRRMALLEVADFEDSLDDDADLKADVVRILATAVLRVLKNPDGKRQESIDDYTWTLDQAVSAGLLYFTDDELDSLVPGSGVEGRAYSVDPLADYATRWDA
jgi:hypothetical protein